MILIFIFLQKGMRMKYIHVIVTFDDLWFAYRFQYGRVEINLCRKSGPLPPCLPWKELGMGEGGHRSEAISSPVLGTEQ